MNPDTAGLRRARIGVFGCFATSGFVMGAWAAALPSVDARLGLGEARLGTVLLLIQVVGLGTMFIAGRIADKITTRRLLRWIGPFTQLALVAPAIAPTYETLLAGAVVYGLGVSFVEVGTNAHSVELEHYYGRPIISSFHGFWSLGGAAAGALTSFGLTMGLGSEAMLVTAGIASAAAFAGFARPLLPPPSEATGGASGRAGRIGAGLLAAMFALGAAGTLIESGASDWANLHAARVLDADAALAPLSYTVFGCVMTVLRLAGDPIRARLGPGPTMFWAGAAATAGYALVLASGAVGGLPLAWAGWILAGCGIAIIVPVLFSAIGEAGGSPSQIAVMSMSGGAGLLLGPAAIGYLAEGTNLTIGLMVPAALSVFTLAAGPITMRRVLRRPDRGAPHEPVAAAASRDGV
ncbi:MFS transporter [Glycomyces arizonensis]|uniref:MFS transporter n=1 Tax=Glycomyces arizonensis TaxID=256035 RepID=UPI000406F354|nr:MFS transporter [Glycomyces arizonensis]